MESQFTLRRRLRPPSDASAQPLSDPSTTMDWLSDDLLALTLSKYADLETLRSVRAVSRKLAKLARQVVCDAEWQSASPDNAMDLACAMWAEGSYTIASLVGASGRRTAPGSSRHHTAVAAVACNSGHVFACAGNGVRIWSAETDAGLGIMTTPTAAQGLAHLAVDQRDGSGWIACAEVDVRSDHGMTEKRKILYHPWKSPRDGEADTRLVLREINWQPPNGNAEPTCLTWHPAGAPCLIHAAIGPFGLNRTLEPPGCGFLHIIRDVAVGWQPNDPLLVGHKELITAVAVDAERDLCASSSLDGTVRLWDVRARGCEIETLGEQRPAAACNHHGRPVYCVDAKGGLIATFVAPRTVKVWDPRTPRAAIDGIAASPEPVCVDTFKCGTHEIRRGVSAFDGTGLLSLDGNGLLACASANGPRIWDLRRTAAHVVELLDDTSPVCALAFGAGGRDRRRLVTGCARGEVQVYEPLV